MAATGASERPAFLKVEDGMLITSHEAEYMVENLKTFDIEQVGSAEWLAQHESIEKLNLQALISLDRFGVLIHELLVIEIWLESVFPRLIKNLADDFSTVTLSLTIHHEGSITNLLEVILYHQDACEAMGSDSLLELADFCCRKLLYLNAEANIDREYKERKASDLINMSIKEEYEEKVSCARFQVSMRALTILRYLTDYIKVLPLCVMVEKYNEGKWIAVPKEDYFKVMKSDAQVWLALYNLIMEPSCRSRYKYTDFHRDQVLKLQKHLNELLVDQIPILKDLQWALEEIALNINPRVEDRNLNSLILEQIPVLRERLLARRNWDHIAKSQLLTTFSKSDSSSHQIQEILRIFQFGESMEAPKCACCGAEAVQRCSRCQCEWYCGKACQKKVWTHHRKICDIMKDQH